MNFHEKALQTVKACIGTSSYEHITLRVSSIGDKLKILFVSYCIERSTKLKLKKHEISKYIGTFHIMRKNIDGHFVLEGGITCYKKIPSNDLSRIETNI